MILITLLIKSVKFYITERIVMCSQNGIIQIFISDLLLIIQ